MAIIRKVFGPFAAETTSEKRWDAAMNATRVHLERRWSFFGIRGDKTMGHWTLIYDADTRKFRAQNNPPAELVGRRNRSVTSNLPKQGIDETVHPDAWLDGSRVMDGTITQILKSKLPPAEIARATALAVLRK